MLPTATLLKTLLPKTLLPKIRCLPGSMLLCGVLLGFGCQPANNPEPKVNLNIEDAALDAHAVADVEQLWLTPPVGWNLASNQVTNTGANKTAVRHVRYIDPTEPTHSLTIESRQNSTLGQPAADPLEVLEQLAQNEQRNCTKAEDFNTFTGLEQGFGTVVRLFICEPSRLTSGRLTLLKIIQGQQQTYLVALQHQWSNEPSATSQESLGLDENSNNIFDRVAGWSLYMRSVKVCAASGCQQRDN
jgi:hypothetical protein